MLYPERFEPGDCTAYIMSVAEMSGGHNPLGFTMQGYVVLMCLNFGHCIALPRDGHVMRLGARVAVKLLERAT